MANPLKFLKKLVKLSAGEIFKSRAVGQEPQAESIRNPLAFPVMCSPFGNKVD